MSELVADPKSLIPLRTDGIYGAYAIGLYAAQTGTGARIDGSYQDRPATRSADFPRSPCRAPWKLSVWVVNGLFCPARTSANASARSFSSLRRWPRQRESL